MKRAAAAARRSGGRPLARRAFSKDDVLRAVDAAVPAIIYTRTARGDGWHYAFVGGRGAELLGFSGVGPNAGAVIDPDVVFEADRERVVASYADAVSAGRGSWSEEFRVKAKGGVRWLRAAVEIRGEEGREASSLGVLLDVTEEKRAAERLALVHERDALTALYNRDYFERAVALAVERYAAEKRLFVVVIFAIDDFYEINDAHGVDAGDRLLKLVSGAALEAVRGDDIVARLGDRKFGILAEVKEVDEAHAFGLRILNEIGRRYRVGTSEIEISLSVGCALPTRFGARATDLMHDAGSALERARSEGGAKCRLYAEEMTVESVMRVTLKEGLRDALERSQFSLVYQPKIDLGTGRTIGCEALLRWRDPVLGEQSPSDFIPIAERSGLIVPIGDWVFREACRQSVAWTQSGMDLIPISVNVSPVQFARSDVHKSIADAMAETGAPPGSIDVEITESLLVDCSEALIGVLESIRRLGSQISLDDFGTGFSSINYLKQLPLSLLKIDQSFARGAPNSAIDAAIVRSIVYLANELGLRVIAEGAETAEQVGYLRNVGCHEIQGYYFSRPLPPAKFAAFVAASEPPRVRGLRLSPRSHPS